MGKEAVNINIITDPLWKKILKRPFSYYCRAGGITFGIVFATNFISSFSKFGSNVVDYPGIFTTIILLKSARYAALWPSFYLKLFTKPSSVLMPFGNIAQEDIEVNQEGIKLKKDRQLIEISNNGIEYTKTIENNTNKEGTESLSIKINQEGIGIDTYLGERRQ